MAAVAEMALENALDTLVRAVVADQDFQRLVTLGQRAEQRRLEVPWFERGNHDTDEGLFTHGRFP